MPILLLKYQINSCQILAIITVAGEHLKQQLCVDTISELAMASRATSLNNACTLRVLAWPWDGKQLHR